MPNAAATVKVSNAIMVLRIKCRQELKTGFILRLLRKVYTERPNVFSKLFSGSWVLPVPHAAYEVQNFRVTIVR